MDLKNYFRKVREAEASILSPHVVVVSLPTRDGGVGGRLTEMSRELAAKLLVEGRARLAEEADLKG